MNATNYVISILFLFLSYNLLGQDKSVNPPETTSLSGMDILWAQLEKDDQLNKIQNAYPNLNSQITGYELLLEDYLIDDSKGFYLYKDGPNFGSYLVCRNLQSGEILWQTSYNTVLDETIELYTNIYKNRDGNIEISGMRLLNPNVPNLFPFGLPIRTEIEPVTGNLINKSYTPYNQGGCICANSNGQLGRTFESTSSNSYFTICSYPQDGYILNIQEIDDEGSFLDTINQITNPLVSDNIQLHLLLDAKKISNGNYLIASSSSADVLNPNLTTPELIFINSNGTLIKRVDLSEYIGSVTTYSIDVQDDHLLISSRDNTGTLNDPIIEQRFVITDINGDNFINLSELLDNDISNYKATSLSDGRFLLVGSEDNCLQYLTTDSNSQLEEVASICYEDESWTLRPNNIRMINDDILTSVQWVNSDGVTYESNILADASGLGLSTATIEQNDEIGTDLSIHPNPTADRINILTELRGDMNIKVYSSIGIHLITQRLSETNRSLDISDLKAGSYWIEIKQNDKSFAKQFIKL